MKSRRLITFLVFFAAVQTLPGGAIGGNEIDRWTAGSWSLQDMISWGDEMLIVDYGVNGLWKFDGGWSQLSRWDPDKIVAWNKNNLAVDFGNRGLWTYNGSSWTRISAADKGF